MPDAPGAVRTPLTSIAASPVYGQTFSPGVPLAPAKQEQVRAWDFPVSVNTRIHPRSPEPFGFKHLRAFSNIELVRMAIETRKDQIERLDWAIKPKDKKKSADGRIDDLTAFWQKPGGKPFSVLMRALIEDLLAIDAPAAEKRRTRGGKLLGLDYIPGDTIAIKVDETGRVPEGPDDIAYQQVIKGVVWNNLSNRDILYFPRNVRPGHVYGFGPTEQIIVTINTIMRRQAAQLAHFTASNIPSGLLNAPEGWNLDKIKELQDWLDDKVSGNTDEQAKILWGPAGSKYQAFKESPIKDDFDEWLARVVAFAFSLPPTPFIRQMNKGTAGEDQDRALEEGLEPLKLWGKRWIDDIIATEQGAPDLEFVWVDTPSIDPGKQSTIDDTNLRNGTTTIDEIRDSRGLEPLPDGLGKEPLVYTSTGPVLLKDVLAEPEPTPVEPGAPQQVVDENGNPVPPAPAAAPKPAPGAQPPAKAPHLPVAPAVAEKLARAKVTAKKTLYVSRDLTNASKLVEWAKENGFDATLPKDDMHTTVAYSREPVDWDAMGDSFDTLQSKGGERSLDRFDGGAVVLRFELQELGDRWQEFIDHGASWDHPEYKPHITISYAADDIDLTTITPFTGTLNFGPEKFDTVKEGWAAGTTEKLAKGAKLISCDRPKARRHIVAITKALRPILAKAGDEAAVDVAKALKAITKDTPSKAKNTATATDIAAKADLSALAGIGPAIQDDLSDLAANSGDLALTIAVNADDAITNRVHQRAVDYAKQRAADLVSVDGPDSLVASTRAMIRDTIASGLENNIGSEAIADALQEGYAFSAERAATIAKTEISMANGAGKKAGWQAVVDSGVELVKGWTVTSDGNCCDDCQGNEADGEIPFDQDFSSGDDMEPAHPNCSCATYAHSVQSDGSDDDEGDD